jgi:hypothetical protein
MNTPHYLPAVREYAEAVRAALTGLPPADIAEMTDGLEADLVAALEDEFPTPDDGEGPGGERVLTAATMAERFGPPEDYVRELRQAAGLDDPPREARGRRARRRARRARAAAVGEGPRPRRRMVRGAIHHGRAAVRRLRAAPWWPGAAAAGKLAAPAWWVIRAWAIMTSLTQVIFPRTITELALFAGFLAASLLLGNVRWSAQVKPLRVLMATVNGILAIVTIGAWSHATSGIVVSEPAPYVEMAGTYMECATDGGPVCAGGEPVSNIFAYDVDGNPIDLVQLFDAEGRPLRVVNEDDYLASDRYIEWQSEDVDTSTGELRSVTWSNLALVMDGTNRPVWNAYPVRTRLETESTATGARTVGPDIVPPFPLRLAPELTTNDAEEAEETESSPSPTTPASDQSAHVEDAPARAEDSAPAEESAPTGDASATPEGEPEPSGSGFAPGESTQPPAPSPTTPASRSTTPTTPTTRAGSIQPWVGTSGATPTPPPTLR